MKHRVLVTGLGIVSCMGLNLKAFWDEIKKGRSGIKPFDLPIEGTKMSVAATVKGFNPEKYFSAKELSFLERCSQFAIVAAREAISDAGLVIGERPLMNAASIVGCAGAGQETFDEASYRLYKEHRSRVHPLSVPKGMACSVISQVSIHLRIKGPAFLISTACASGAHALIQGVSMIQSGMVDVALVGGTETPFNYVQLKSWDALRIVSNDTCRPFSKDRSGMVLGEGAGMLVLESEEHAKKRNANIYAEISGYGMTSDAGHMTRPDVSSVANAMKNTLRNAGINADEVDYINAHGTGTLVNDIAETKAIHKAFGDHAKKLTISSTKSMHGHALGATSALELVATTLALKNSVIPPTANFTVADEQCDLDYVPNDARKQNINTALSNSFAFGGLNAVVALNKHA